MPVAASFMFDSYYILGENLEYTAEYSLLAPGRQETPTTAHSFYIGLFLQLLPNLQWILYAVSQNGPSEFQGIHCLL